MTLLYGILYMSLPMILVTIFAIIAIIKTENIKNDIIAFIIFWITILFTLLIGMYISEFYIKTLAYS